MDFAYKDHTYRLGTLSAMTQLHVAKRLLPLVGSMGEGGIGNLLAAIGSLSDEDSEYVIGKCLAGCKRVTDTGTVAIYSAGSLQFDDIGASGMLALTIATVKDQLSDFFTGLRSNLSQTDS